MGVDNCGGCGCDIIVGGVIRTATWLGGTELLWLLWLLLLLVVGGTPESDSNGFCTNWFGGFCGCDEATDEEVAFWSIGTELLLPEFVPVVWLKPEETEWVSDWWLMIKSMGLITVFVSMRLLCCVCVYYSIVSWPNEGWGDRKHFVPDWHLTPHDTDVPAKLDASLSISLNFATRAVRNGKSHCRCTTNCFDSCRQWWSLFYRNTTNVLLEVQKVFVQHTHRRVVWLVVGSCECGCVRERRVEFVRGQRWFVKLTPSPSEGWLAFRVVTLTKIDLIIYANNFLLMSHWHYWLRNYLSTTEFALQRPASLLNERYWIRVVVRRCERSYRYWIDIRRMNVHIRNQATRKEPQTADALFGTSNQQHNHD